MVSRSNVVRLDEQGMVRLPQLSKREQSQLLGSEIGTSFDMYTRLFSSFQGGDVFEVGEWSARDMELMLRRDGDGLMLEQALTLPLLSATYTLNGAKGDSGELELVQNQLETPSYSGGISPSLDIIIAQMAEACIYRKAFFEKKWNLDNGTVKLAKLAWRPASTCEVKRDERTAAFDGFRQRAWWFSSDPKKKNQYGKNFTGYLDIPRMRSFVHIHGTRRQPLIGISDLDVAFWAYKQKQKMLFLWFMFLENQSLPKLAVYGADPDQANANADSIAQMKASAVAGFQRPPPGTKLFDVIESSGSGAQQFRDALSFLSSYQTKSVMAGFLELGNAAALGRGSYALSESQSQFFLQSREAAKKEMCSQFTAEVIAPIVVLNRGPDAAIPTLNAAPLTEADSQQIVTTLNALAIAPKLNIPPEYLDLLAEKAGTVFDLPTDRVREVLSKAADYRAEQAAQAGPLGASPQGQGAARIAGATDAAAKLAMRAIGGTGGATAKPNAAAE